MRGARARERPQDAPLAPGTASMNASVSSGSEVLAAYLTAITQKDLSAIDRLFHQDVEYVVNGATSGHPKDSLPIISAQCRDALPWLGVYRGRAAVKVFLRHMHRNLEVTAFGTRMVISEGNTAAAFGWFRLHALPTGRTVDIPYSIMLEVRDGLIARYHFLENTFDVALAFSCGGEWLIDTDGRKRSVFSR